MDGWMDAKKRGGGLNAKKTQNKGTESFRKTEPPAEFQPVPSRPAAIQRRCLFLHGHDHNRHR